MVQFCSLLASWLSDTRNSNDSEITYHLNKNNNDERFNPFAVFNKGGIIFGLASVLLIELFSIRNPLRGTIDLGSKVEINVHKNINKVNEPYGMSIQQLLTQTGGECTSEQIHQIQQQLPDTKCNGKNPWTQQCSITKATGCVEATWLYDHFKYDYTSDYSSSLPSLDENNDSSNIDELWIGINIGCNKGFDAINIGRMLSGDIKTFDREKWKKPLLQQNVNINVGCELKSAQYEPPTIDRTMKMTRRRTTHVYCVEPMPLTVEALQHSASVLQIPSRIIDSTTKTSSSSSSSKNI
jgi:hypothetical protein